MVSKLLLPNRLLCGYSSVQAEQIAIRIVQKGCAKAPFGVVGFLGGELDAFRAQALAKLVERLNLKRNRRVLPADRADCYPRLTRLQSRALKEREDNECGVQISFVNSL